MQFSCWFKHITFTSTFDEFYLRCIFIKSQVNIECKWTLKQIKLHHFSAHNRVLSNDDVQFVDWCTNKFSIYFQLPIVLNMIRLLVEEEGKFFTYCCFFQYDFEFFLTIRHERFIFVLKGCKNFEKIFRAVERVWMLF